jgi:PAS domain S-box-containing protein
MREGDDTILIVDDNPANLQLLRMVLSDEGYSVRVATSGAMALKTISAAMPDLILLDIKMPEMDGYEICRLLQEDEEKKGIPILFISAQYSVEDETKGLGLGAVDYIVKPIRAPIILARVKTHLENYKHKEHLEKVVKERTAELEQRMDKLNHEISERKQAEKEIQRTKAILAKAEHMGNIGSWEFEHIKKKTYWSDELYLIFGLIPQDIEASYDSYVGYIHPDDKEMVIKAFSCSLKTKHPYDMVHRFKLKDDSIKYVNVKCETVFDKDSLPLKSIGMVRDISEEYKLQEQLNHKSKMDAIGQLAEGMAHDFNNVLSGIIIASQLLQEPDRHLDESGREYVEMILQASERATDLIKKLMAFGRKDNKMFSSIDIHTIIDETIALLNRTIDKKIKISVLKKAELSIVVGDDSALENSLLNLAINASHAMVDGGELRIETRNITLDKNYCDSSPFELSEGYYIEIEVRDTGSGIDPKNIEKIFEPFFTTKEQGIGTGLGLASVHETIQNHFGAVFVNSELGIGTVFHLYLPCSEKTITVKNYNEIPFQGSGQILLVDDEDLIRLTGKHLLEGMGFSVLLAENGLEALEIFERASSEIDLIIMDGMMPIMNGTKAFYKMREIDKNCKVILSSGFINEEDLNELKESGLSGFIQKPFRKNEFSKLLSEVLSL